MSLNQRVGYVFGAVYVLVGLIGFAVTGGVGFASNEGNLLLGIFEVNPLHNLVHLAIGAALVAGAAGGPATSRSVNLAVGVVYVLVGIVGFFIQDTGADILALNVADHILHLVSGALLVVVATRAAQSTTARA